MIFRCFFNKKAEVVLNVIQSTFQTILKFRSHVVSETLYENSKTKAMEHKSFESLVEIYKDFKMNISFLYKGKFNLFSLKDIFYSISVSSL